MREDCTAVGRSWREGGFRKSDHTRMPGKKVSSVLHNCTTDSLTLAFLWGRLFVLPHFIMYSGITYTFFLVMISHGLSNS